MTEYEQGQLDLIAKIKKEVFFILENPNKEDTSIDLFLLLTNLKPIIKNKKPC